MDTHAGTRRDTVVFVCDAGPQYGVGHVMRCLALAEEFAARGAAVVIVADLAAVPWARDQVVRRGHAVIAPPSADRYVADILGLDPVLVVLDSYVLPDHVYQGFRIAGVPTLALVDGDPAGRPADLWLDQNLGAESDTWEVPDGTSRLAGTRYALMRDEIRTLRPVAPADEDHEVPTVFSFFGGTDAFGAAPIVLAHLVATGLPWRAVFVAAAQDLADRCRAVPLAGGQRLWVRPPTQELAAAVRDADVVLSAAGTSSWELFCLGSASGLVCVAENQAVSYGRTVAAGLAVGLGYLEALGATSAESLAELLVSPQRRRTLRERAWNEVDGRGRERVADACWDRWGILGG